jgi:hypothetical protein
MLRKYLFGFLAAAFSGTAAFGAMPAAQQNAMVAKYCAVCHTDAHPNGGLSLEHFDAAKPDPGLVAMLVSKLKSNALGASGQPLPDKATQDALMEAFVAESEGSNRWVVNTQAPVISASIVRELPSTARDNDGAPDVYRLTVTCRADTREGHMQVAWSPAVPAPGREVPVAVDGKALFTYKVEGKEKMGNGQGGTSGPGAVVLYTSKPDAAEVKATDFNASQEAAGMPKAMPLPRKTLTVSHAFADSVVEFPFAELDRKTRQGLTACFSGDSGRLSARNGAPRSE